MHSLIAYTDGACSGNPGPGGWGVVLQAKSGLKITKQRELNGGAADTTNNRMELMAAIMSLNELKRPCEVHLHTDSKYVQGGILEWMFNWKKNGWKNAAKKPVKNAELWQQLDEARSRHQVKWHWVKGHAGIPENEKADELARLGMEPYKK